MDYLAAMQAFVRSVDLGSFSKAAAGGGLKVSTVSRYVRALEADLLARLREIRERQMGEAPRPGEMKVTGVEATIHGEE